MNVEEFNGPLTIALGVLSGLAIVYAGVQTWGWSRRAGKVAIDFQTIIKFVLFTIGVLGNVFFIVSFGFSVWLLIFYKVRVLRDHQGLWRIR